MQVSPTSIPNQAFSLNLSLELDSRLISRIWKERVERLRRVRHKEGSFSWSSTPCSTPSGLERHTRHLLTRCRESAGRFQGRPRSQARDDRASVRRSPLNFEESARGSHLPPLIATDRRPAFWSRNDARCTGCYGFVALAQRAVIKRVPSCLSPVRSPSYRSLTAHGLQPTPPFSDVARGLTGRCGRLSPYRRGLVGDGDARSAGSGSDRRRPTSCTP
jgi:hypothetical protein